MCCLNHREWLHTKTYLWRLGRSMKRSNQAFVTAVAIFIEYVAVAIVLRAVAPIEEYDGGPNFDRMYNYTTSRFYQDRDHGRLNFSEAC